ncbi:MAG TPA: tetratricopeptide repeat protein [Polyangia bacterium]|jgi:tetratricopeptide (TPR) repeat protein
MRGQRAAGRLAARIAACAILLAAVAAPARPVPPGQPGRIDRLIAEWRYEEARDELAPLLGQHPRDPHYLFLDGELRFLAGDYAGATARLREAIGLNRGAEEWKGLRDLVAATERETQSYATTASAHFVLRYPAGKDALLAPYAVEALESAFRVLAEDLGYQPPPGRKIRVEIYPEVVSLARVSPLTEREIRTSGTVALCKYNRLMIVSPRALERGYPWLDTLGHELTHYVISRVSHNTVPIWLHEGIAKFEERRWRAAPGGGMTPSMEHLLATALKKGRLITFEQMHPSMAKLPSQEDAALAFAEVYTVIEYLYQQKGYAGLRALLTAMRDGVSEPRAMAQTMGMSMDELQRAWRHHLKELGLKQRAGFVPHRLKFRRPGGKSAKNADQELSDIPEQRARRHARLGGLLRARRRLVAAATEYQRALGILGRDEPLLANRLARTYLEMGDPQKAISAAEPALALYPDLPGPHATIGQAYLKRKDLAHAAEHLTAALRLSPFNPVVHCGLWEVYRQRGSAELAEREQRFCAQLGQAEEE